MTQKPMNEELITIVTCETLKKLALKQQLSTIKSMIEGMEQITMIPPGKFGDGRPTQIPTDDYGKGYNQALSDLLTELQKIGE